MTEQEKKAYEIFYESMDKYNYIAPILAFNDTFTLNIDTGSHYFDPQKDSLCLNARVINGENLYVNFYHKYLTKNMELNKRLFNEHDVFPAVLSTLSNDGKGRTITFTHYRTCISFLGIFKQYDEIKGIPKEEVEMLDYTRNVLRSLMKEISDYLKDDSPLPDNLKKLCPNDETNPKLYLKIVSDSIKEYILILRYLKQDYERSSKLSIEEFKKCFDIDKLYLLISKSIVEHEKNYVKQLGGTSPAFGQLLHYMDSVASAHIINYNPKIKLFNPETKKIDNYSLQDLAKEIKELLKYFNKDDYTFITYDDIDKLGLNDNENVQKLNRLINSDMAADISVNWKLIPKGKRNVIPKEKIEEKADKNPKNDSKSRLREGEVYYRLMTFQDTDYMLEMIGEEKFAGYIGFIYDNGLVVFEKLFDDAERTIPSRIGNATYIMTIENFAKFTKMDKNELIAYMKRTDSEEIKRVCHNKNWKNKLTNIIAGIDYTAETKAMVDALIQKYQDLNKKEV